MKIKQLDHIAIHVSDVVTSSEFYKTTLLLSELPRPAFDFPGAWFRLGATQSLHLLGNRTKAVDSERRGNHFALQIDDADQWEQHFKELNLDFIRKLRPDGAHQIFLQDPDGHWLELTCA